MQLLLVHTILLLEAADTSAGVDDLLLTGKEGVALPRGCPFWWSRWDRRRRRHSEWWSAGNRDEYLLS